MHVQSYGYGWPDGRLGGLGPPGSTTPVEPSLWFVSNWSFQIAVGKDNTMVRNSRNIVVKIPQYSSQNPSI